MHLQKHQSYDNYTFLYNKTFGGKITEKKKCLPSIFCSEILHRNHGLKSLRKTITLTLK